MDSLTHAVLGATMQGALLGRWQGRKALLYGALLATLPDLDVLIDYGDPVANMTHHRGFSHSLFVISAFSLLLTGLLRHWRPDPRYGSGRLLLTIWLVLTGHVLLDGLTSYGTQLLWPLARPPVAWSSLFIIDPLYTLPLLAVVLVAVVRGVDGRSRRWQCWALGLSSLYLGFTLAGKQMAEERVEQVLAREGVRTEALFSTPAPFNSLLWRVVALDGEHYHEALVGWFDRLLPEPVRLPRGSHWRAVLAGSPQHARLEWFSRGVLRYDRVGEDIVATDLRMGIPGFHPFRFVLAEQRDGRWQTLPVSRRLPMERGGTEQLRVLWRRIWSERPEVSLRQWADRMQHDGSPATKLVQNR